MHNKSSQNLQRRNFINVPRSNLIGCQTRKKKKKSKKKRMASKYWLLAIGYSCFSKYSWVFLRSCMQHRIALFHEISCKDTQTAACIQKYNQGKKYNFILWDQILKVVHQFKRELESHLKMTRDGEASLAMVPKFHHWSQINENV